MADPRQRIGDGQAPLLQIGRSVRPTDWQARTSGGTEYASDVVLPGMLFGAILRSPHAYAAILSIDTATTSHLPGVQAVVTSRDVRGGPTYIHHGGKSSDRPPLATDVVRFVGQEVAAVAADSPRIATEALTSIKVRYRPRRAPGTIGESMRRRALKLHDRTAGRNVSVETRIEWGDTDLAFRDAAFATKGWYRHPQVTHVCMETSATVAWWRQDQERLHIWTSTQSPFFVSKELAHLLGLESGQIEFHEVAVGGGFGARSKITEHEAIASLLSMTSGRPVKLVLTREEEFATTKSRHEFQISLRLALDHQARLTAIDADVLVDNGAYNHTGPSVMATGMRMLGMLYQPKGVRARGRLVDTAKVPGGQFRGYGGPQMAFALESEIDEIARLAGLDPMDLRIQNANPSDQVTLSGARIGTSRLAQGLQIARDHIGWDQKAKERRPGRGLGVAIAIHGSGVFAYDKANQSGARVEIDAEGRVRVRFGGSDAGTGQRTLLAQIAAEELGIAAEEVHVQMMDTTISVQDQGAWSSRGTHFGGNAVWQAARSARDKLLDKAREKFSTDEVWLEAGTARSAYDRLPLGDLVGAMSDLDGGVLVCEETFEDMTIDPTTKFATDGRANASPNYTFAVHAAEVQVDLDTGKIDILDYVAVHDVGRVINPVQVEGQIIGGVVMGLGAALREEMIFDHGRLANPAYMHYGAPRAADVPRIKVVLIDEAETSGPFGAKNVGEISIMPVAPAVGNAVRDATGVRIRELPITPDKIVTHFMSSPSRPGIKSWRHPDRWWISGMRWLYPRGLEMVMHRWGTRLARKRSATGVIAVERPTSLEDANRFAARGYTPIGGGTELHLLRRQGLVDAPRIVSLGFVPELTEVERADDGSIVIGAAVTLVQLSEILGDDLPILDEALRTIASAQIRSVASVGGNLLQEKRCVFFRSGFNCYKRGGPTCPCYAVAGDHRFYHAAIDGHRCQAVTPSDLATVFVALGAEVDLVRGGEIRSMPIGDLYVGPGESCLADGEVLRSVRIPPQAFGMRGAFEKLQLWSGDFAVASVALTTNIDLVGHWTNVKVCVGGVSPTPWEATQTQRSAEGRILTPKEFRKTLGDELWQASNPLPANAWKIHSAAALGGRAAERLLWDSGRKSS